MAKIKLPSISKVKKALHDDWALRVKQRDGWKCLLCGGTELLTAHHWYVTSQRGHAARYCVDNGATLCFTCHIREVHENPGYATINAVRKAVMANSPNFDEANIERLTCIELGTAELRSLWDAMRARPVKLPTNGRFIDRRGKKIFINVISDHPIAVVGNTMQTEWGLFDVLVVTRFSYFFHYTVKEILS